LSSDFQQSEEEFTGSRRFLQTISHHKFQEVLRWSRWSQEK